MSHFENSGSFQSSAELVDPPKHGKPLRARQKAAWKVARSRWLVFRAVSILSRKSLVIGMSLLCIRFAAHSMDACHDTLQHRVVEDCKVLKFHVDVGRSGYGRGP